jgi:type IV pilus assembly protein PilW
MKSVRGFSLIELLVALAIGLIVVLVLTVVIVRTSGAQRELALANRQLENGRYALQAIADDLHNAGYVGPVASIPVATGIPNVCSTGASAPAEFLKALDVGVFPLAVRPGCIDAANHVAGTDMLAVVHASSVPTPVANLKENVLYTQTDTQTVRVAVGSGNSTADANTFNLVNKDLVTRADIRQLQVYIYYVSPCNRPASGTTCTSAADGGQPIPTLRRMSLNGTSFVTQPIAEGIENLQIELGLDNISNDGAPDQYTGYSTANPTQAELMNATAVGVHLLARNTEKTVGFTDGKNYSLGATSVAAANDNYKRHVFSRVIRLNNISGRRAS